MEAQAWLPRPGSNWRQWRERARDPALSVMLGVQLLLVFVAGPGATIGYPGSRLAVQLLLLGFAFLVLIVSRGASAAVVAALAMLLLLAGTVPSSAALPDVTPSLAHIGTIAGSIVVTIAVGRAVLAPGVVTRHRVIGAVVLYLNFGLVFGATYRLLRDFVPTCLSGIPEGIGSWESTGTILYFSFVTLTTTGYGDIAPVHPIARSLANLGGIIGQLYPATLLARLITLELEGRRE